MEMEMPLDLVALVRCFFGRDCASSKANLSTRSTPMRVNTDSCNTNSRSVPGKAPAPNARVLALGVFAQDVKIDSAGRAGRAITPHDGSDDAGHQARGPQVDVLVELAAKQQQRSPQGHMVGNLVRPADRAEINRI